MATSTETSTVKVSEIEVPEGFNPRREFDETALEQLAASIKKNGITTALTVARENGHFVLIDGERRLRAAKKAGVKEVPVLVRDDENALAAALVANVQREDLNPIEEAEALRRLSEVEGLGTHKALAEQVGKPVPFVSKRLRLLALPEGCHAGIASGEIPLAAEPQLRAIAKASPEVAVAAVRAGALGGRRRRATWSIIPATSCGRCASGRARRSSATSRTGRRSASWFADEEKASELEIRLEQTVENRTARTTSITSTSAWRRQDVDRLRASGKLIELPERLGVRLRSALPGRLRAGRRSGGARRSSAPSSEAEKAAKAEGEGGRGGGRRRGAGERAAPRGRASGAPQGARGGESARPRGPRPSTPSSARRW